ncbi:response regulator [Sinomicrobium weinanense]|uniref:Response regulator transcription factor n=1 Tax=Sinomicrobium weinanense TaxID=2842200 RepID=A0A926Q202_9FLAO|nr:response regulator transcription factor [Sinomicrobium weinanense]MBC9796043.1 response regulator transcription factor [Sinomicrobium weinanense]MBU3123138.1 response regulator transcription factor [Sinomicrobium weinanense]
MTEINENTLLSGVKGGPDGSRPTILVIEDNLMMLRTLTLILNKQGYKVVEARNGKEALMALKEQHYDLVLTDLMLPYANGYEIIGKLKENIEQRQIPVIILSAVHDEEAVLDGFGIGADDYVKKPFTPGELLSRVSRLIDK